MNTEQNNIIKEIHNQPVHFNRGKYTELLNNSQLQSTIHARFRMFSHLSTRSKLLLAGVALVLTTAVVSTAGYFIKEATVQEQLINTINSSNTTPDNSSLTAYTHAMINCYYSPPDTYPNQRGRILKSEPHINNHQLEKLRVLELSDAELSKIGVSINRDSIQWLLKNANVAEILQYTLSSTGDESGGYPTNKVTLPENVKATTIHPRMITDTLGNVRYTTFSYYEVNEELAVRAYTFNKQFSRNRNDPNQITKDSIHWQLHQQSVKLFNPNKLIPILVHTTSKKSNGEKNWLPNAIIWYDATPELQKLLPKDAVTRLLNSPEPQPELLGSYFDARSPQERSLDSSYAIFNVMAYPNPVNGKTLTIRYNLHKEEEITISLYDINGNFMQQLQQPTLRIKQLNNDVVHLPALSPGVYLVVVSNSNQVMRTEQLLVR